MSRAVMDTPPETRDSPRRRKTLVPATDHVAVAEARQRAYKKEKSRRPLLERVRRNRPRTSRTEKPQVPHRAWHSSVDRLR